MTFADMVGPSGAIKPQNWNINNNNKRSYGGMSV